ncbi:hypothetical protein JXM83_05275 [Candidatus Woesearchaeota archaeon]|nr:hypothetical protein [Candidatus Woesearchaeota archaeon]
MIESNSKAVIITIARNTALSVRGGLKKKDKTNFEIPVTIKLSVKNILKVSSIFDEAM